MLTQLALLRCFLLSSPLLSPANAASSRPDLARNGRNSSGANSSPSQCHRTMQGGSGLGVDGIVGTSCDASSVCGSEYMARGLKSWPRLECQPTSPPSLGQIKPRTLRIFSTSYNPGEENDCQPAEKRRKMPALLVPDGGSQRC